MPRWWGFFALLLVLQLPVSGAQAPGGDLDVEIEVWEWGRPLHIHSFEEKTPRADGNASVTVKLRCDVTSAAVLAQSDSRVGLSLRIPGFDTATFLDDAGEPIGDSYVWSVPIAPADCLFGAAAELTLGIGYGIRPFFANAGDSFETTLHLSDGRRSWTSSWNETYGGWIEHGFAASASSRPHWTGAHSADLAGWVRIVGHPNGDFTARPVVEAEPDEGRLVFDPPTIGYGNGRSIHDVSWDSQGAGADRFGAPRYHYEVHFSEDPEYVLIVPGVALAAPPPKEQGVTVMFGPFDQRGGGSHGPSDGSFPATLSVYLWGLGMVAIIAVYQRARRPRTL